MRHDAWGDHWGTSLGALQLQVETEKRAVDRHFQQLDRQVQGLLARLEAGTDALRDTGMREKLAEMQGSVAGLMEEVQSLARRADSVDDRLWARANGAEELARHGTRDLQHQLQSLERQARLQQASVEDAQRRQQARQRRLEKVLEDLEWRLGSLEEEGRAPELGDPAAAEEQLQGLCAELEALQARLVSVEALQEQTLKPCGGLLESSRSEGGEVSELRHRLSALEGKASSQIEELHSTFAAVRVKVESQAQRQNALSERLEQAHVPTLEAIRHELAAERGKDMRNFEDRLVDLSHKVQRALDGTDASNNAENWDALLQRTAELESASDAWQRELQDLRSSLRKEVLAVMVQGSMPSRSNGRLAAYGPSRSTVDGNRWPLFQRDMKGGTQQGPSSPLRPVETNSFLRPSMVPEGEEVKQDSTPERSNASPRSSFDIAVSQDESVNDALVLPTRCDTLEDVIQPGASRSPSCSGGPGADAEAAMTGSESRAKTGSDSRARSPESGRRSRSVSRSRSNTASRSRSRSLSKGRSRSSSRSSASPRANHRPASASASESGRSRRSDVNEAVSADSAD